VCKFFSTLEFSDYLIGNIYSIVIYTPRILKMQVAFNTCKNVLRGASLPLKAERGDSVFATRYQTCGSDPSFKEPKAKAVS
jgi:hypothetical protein